MTARTPGLGINDRGLIGDEVMEVMECLIKGLVDHCKAFDFYSE
jgi:hypothetical protein